MGKAPKVLIGMSGGLDSSVVAAMLKKQGYDCVGLYLNVWSDPSHFDPEEKKKFPQNKCCSLESLMLARSICQDLDIPFYSMNIEDEFKEQVVDFFLDGFKHGETPNPCVRCNKTIKFGAMFDKMRELGCDYLATGHYAHLETDSKGQIHLLMGEDSAKDQSYFLYNLTQDKLKHLLFPLGAYTKDKAREMAEEFGLKKVLKKRESQGVCFYPEKTYMPFIGRFLKEENDYTKGEIQNTSGEKIGDHTGLPFYTIGQRKGIGIGGGPALYVNKMDSIKNVLIVGSEDELLADKVEIRDCSFLSGQTPSEDEDYDIRIRSHGKTTRGRLKIEGKRSFITFEKPVRAIMAGQSLVLYKGKELIGGGILGSSVKGAKF